MTDFVKKPDNYYLFKPVCLCSDIKLSIGIYIDNLFELSIIKVCNIKPFFQNAGLCFYYHLSFCIYVYICVFIVLDGSDEAQRAV